MTILPCCSDQPRFTGLPILPTSAPVYRSGDPDFNPIDFFKAKLNAIEEETRELDCTVYFVSWVLMSDFFRLQLPELFIGEPLANYPAPVETAGIKGESVYTALFRHIDMKIFTCKTCGHIVMDSLQDTVTHQRAVHFARS